MFDDTREAWAALPSTNPVPLDLSKVNRFYVHWEGTALGDLTEHDRCLYLVRNIQRYHQGTKGWADIGYSGLVCPHGRSIEGRGDHVGAHTAGYNDTAYGWCILAGPEDPATQEALSRTAKAARECELHVGRPLGRFGHRDAAATDCPGDAIYAWVHDGMLDPFPPDEEEEAMTREQAEAIIAGIATLTDAVNRHGETLSLVLAKVMMLPDIETSLATAISQDTQDIIEAVQTVAVTAPAGVEKAVDSALARLDVTSRFIRRA